MNRVALKQIPLRSNRFSGWAPKVQRVLFGLFLLQFALVWARLWLSWLLFGNARWPDGFLVVLTAATLIASLTDQLPGQSVMLASLIMAIRRPKQNSIMAPTTRGDVEASRSSCRVAGGDQRSR